MFGAFGKKAAKKQAAKKLLLDQYRAQFGVYIQNGDMEGIINNDSYAAGYFFGKQANMLAHMINTGQAERSDRDELTFLLMEDLFGGDAAGRVLRSIRHHFEAKDSQFSEGSEKAARVVAFAVGALPYRSDPDYSMALARFQDKETAYGSMIASDDHSAVILGFEQLWIGDRLERLVFGDNG